MEAHVALARALVLALAMCDAQALAQTSHSRKLTGVDHFRSYALSVCLAQGYSAFPDVEQDAARSARAHLEFGTLPLEAHTEATQLARVFLARKYESTSGADLVLMKCIDLTHSRELDDILKRYLKRRG